MNPFLIKLFPEYDNFLENIDISILDIEDKTLCERELTESDFLEALLSMQNNKTPGNDGLSKEFYVYFWNEIKEYFVNSWKVGVKKKNIKCITKTSNY